MKFKKTKLIITALLLGFSFSSLALAASAQTKGTFNQIEKGLVNTGQNAGYPNYQDNTKTGQAGLYKIITAVINRTLEVLGVVFMILILYGGYLWLSAQGNDAQVEKGKRIIIEAMIGLAVVLAARIIVETITTQAIPPAITT